MIQEKHLNIICLDVPYPVDYGGVFDLFYKIKTLSEAGIKIHLHCFEYGRGKQETLNKYCASVSYYPRKTGLNGLSTSIPYMVQSRRHPQLIKNLLENDYPVLMEGIHCTYYLHTGQLPKHRCFVRLHNVEYEYYHQLAQTTTSPTKKLYYNLESKLLRRYEASLADKATFWSVTSKDCDVYVNTLGYKSIDFLPLYLPEYQPEWRGERGNYCLYHGNLSVPENHKAAVWLLENVFSKVEIPFVIAGKNPLSSLEALAHKYPHTCLVANPDDREIQELIKKAQVNILPSFNSTGIKLKLINALYNGRHCLVNQAGVEGSGLDHCCNIANSTLEMQKAVMALYEKPFTFYNYEYRVEKLRHLFNNANNARQMISWIFEGVETIPGGSKVGL